ncbi:MAG TPA: enoyl-CoA hydratase/isomerase family protein [Gemmataceae bacterium]|nr:enoyl-CoA hydratase/isomerase family protein [Gemmataceae bacterium]
MLFQSERLRLESIDQVATIWLDAHVFDTALLGDLSQALRMVRQSACIDVLVFRSSRPGHFLTGPDLNECARLQDEISLRDFAMRGQYLLERLERISETIPTVAYVDGRCTNAGLELALACDYRLAVARPETLLGCDPLARGWLPCWGATQRLPRLLSLRTAMRLLLEGRLLPARAAHKLGLVDHAFGPRPAKAELNWFLADLQDHPRRPRRFFSRAGWWSRIWEQTRWGRSEVFNSAGKEFFDDPLAPALIAEMERGAKFGPVEGNLAERHALVQSVLAGRQRERFQSARTWENQSLRWHETAVPTGVAVVGLSPRGVELAATALRFGGKATVWDSNESRRQSGAARLQRMVEEGVSAGWWTVAERDQKRKDLFVSRHGEGVGAAELVFLAGSPEEQRMFLIEMECFFNPDCIIVSTEPAAQARVKYPERCVICRFSDSPGSRQVEFVAQAASDGALAKVARWFDHCGYRVHGLPTADRREEKVAAFAA